MFVAGSGWDPATMGARDLFYPWSSSAMASRSSSRSRRDLSCTEKNFQCIASALVSLKISERLVPVCSTPCNASTSRPTNVVVVSHDSSFLRD
jgi:hypothetical protein